MGLIVKNTTIITPLDLIAPHSCRGCGRIGNPLCDCCKNYIILEHRNLCPNCKSIKTLPTCPKCPSLPPSFVIDDRSTIIGNLIHDYKYSSVRALAHPIAEICNAILPQINGKVSLVPLPTISCHIRERGFDHTYKLAKELAKIRHWQVSPLIARARDTVQVGSSENARLSQAKKAYTLKNHVSIDPDTTYILIDDVWTTGASMKAALKLLTNTQATKVVLLILAVSQTKH